MKNLLLSLAMLFLASSTFAQLYVTPNDNGTPGNDSDDIPSYVYVKNQLLFVEQDVNLVRNTNTTTQLASIYLRDESQLLQGLTGSANSGTGYISIYQESNADSYDYNYWCSPVGRSPGGSGNEVFGIRRLNDSITLTESLPTYTTGAFNSVSSPLTISTRWLYRWDPLSQRWLATGAANTVQPGFGFTMKGTDVTVHSDPINEPQNQRYDFRGRPNNGDITLDVETTGVTFTDGTAYYFTFTGNPYPSVLDLNLFFNDTDNQEIDAIRYWDEDRSINSHLYTANKGGYGTWIPGPTPYVDGGVYTRPTFMNYDTSGNPTTSYCVPMNPNNPNETDCSAYFQRLYAPVGQGFMVSANSGVSDATANQITIKNSHRATTFIKEGASNFSEFRNPIAATPMLRLHAVFGDYTHFRDMVLMFSDESTDGFDRGLDATHPSDGAITEAYFPIDSGKNLVIQTVPFEDPKKMIPISFRLDEQAEIELKAAEIINPPFLHTYLYDKLNDTYMEILEEGSAIVVPTAKILLDAGLYEGRFFITFEGKQSTDEDSNGEPIAPQITKSVKFFQNNPVKQLEVSNPDGYDIEKVQLFDMAGKLVYSEDHIGNGSKYEFPTHHLSDAIYLVRLSTVDNQTIVYKINVINK